MKVRELLDVESKWTKGCEASDARGYSVDFNASGASTWCLLGAIHKCYTDEGMIIVLYNKILETLNVKWVGKWNDAPNRTFNDVKQLIMELDI